MKTDVIIIGCGPGGAQAARNLQIFSATTIIF